MINVRHNFNNLAPTMPHVRAFTPNNKKHSRTLSDKQNYTKNVQQKKQINKDYTYQVQKSKNQFKKPLISPYQNSKFYEQKKNDFYATKKQNISIQSYETHCINHHTKLAQFLLQVQDQTMGYCKKCAVKLASQGFTVSKIQPFISQRVSFLQNCKNKQLPALSKYQNNKKYKQIQQFVSELQQIENQHMDCMKKLQKTEVIYEEQVLNTQIYYSQLIQFIQNMREDHLSDLHKKRKRDTQIAYIQHDYLRENVEQMEKIWVDIEGNIENIVQQMEQQQVRNTLRYYKQKILVNRFKIQEMTEFFNKIISLQHEQYQQKLQRVQNYLMKVWNQNSTIQFEQPSYQTYSTLVPHEIKIFPPKSQPDLIKPAELIKNKSLDKNQNRQLKNQKQSKAQTTAFRKLFPEEQEQPKTVTSPQFKQI